MLTPTRINCSGAAWNTREAFAKFIQSELDKWAKVVKVSGATLD